jgi:very-short-patch-repair endonuclease
MLNPDTTAHITVPKHGRFRPLRGVQVHFSDVAPADDHDGVTSPLRTTIDCAAFLPFADALAIADSALRRELITPEALISAASRRQGPKSPQVRRVACQADGGAANPFESCLRAIVLDAGISGFVPQVVLPTSTLSPRVDLANAELQIAIEADSFTYHGSREALLRDCRRYSEIAATGWLLLRFGWEHVMFERDWVASVVVEACALRAGRQKRRSK